MDSVARGVRNTVGGLLHFVIGGILNCVLSVFKQLFKFAIVLTLTYALGRAIFYMWERNTASGGDSTRGKRSSARHSGVPGTAGSYPTDGGSGGGSGGSFNRHGLGSDNSPRSSYQRNGQRCTCSKKPGSHSHHSEEFSQPQPDVLQQQPEVLQGVENLQQEEKQLEVEEAPLIEDLPEDNEDEQQI